MKRRGCSFGSSQEACDKISSKELQNEANWASIAKKDVSSFESGAKAKEHPLPMCFNYFIGQFEVHPSKMKNHPLKEIQTSALLDQFRHLNCAKLGPHEVPT